MSQIIDINAEIVSSKQILWSELKDEIVMMNIDEGSYFSLQGPSARVWELLKEPTSVKAVHAVLIEEYDVPAEQCQQELLGLIQSLHDGQLVNIVDKA